MQEIDADELDVDRKIGAQAGTIQGERRAEGGAGLVEAEATASRQGAERPKRRLLHVRDEIDTLRVPASGDGDALRT